jgi:hypothetical protein
MMNDLKTIGTQINRINADKARIKIDFEPQKEPNSG